MHTFDSLINDFKNANLKPSDNLMIHSSLKSLGEINGGAKTFIQALTSYFSEGLIMFPTHTWNYIQNDGDIFDVRNSKSCVGELTNVAMNTKGFIRSNHPTHSIVCYGKGNVEYIKKDDESSTPTKVGGCFYSLKDINAKILFLGCPLSKNTFVHSIEEYMNVENRFTPKKYHFITKCVDGSIIDYHVYRHYNKFCPHISDNYEKLLPIMLKKNIAYNATIASSNTIIIDSKKCFSLVTDILKKDIEALSDNKDIGGLI